MQGMVELGEDIFLKPVRVAAPQYNGALADMVAQARASVVMGMLEDARLAQQRGYAGSKKNSAGTAGWLARLKEFVVGNF